MIVGAGEFACTWSPVFALERRSRSWSGSALDDRTLAADARYRRDARKRYPLLRNAFAADDNTLAPHRVGADHHLRNSAARRRR